MPDSVFTLMIHLPNGVTGSVLTDASITTTALLQWCISAYELEEHQNLRVFGLRSDEQPAVELKDDDLILPYASTGVRIAPAGEGDVAVPEPASWRQLCEKLPRVGFASRYLLWMNLEQLPEGAIDRASIEESPTGTVLSDEAKQVQQQVRVVDVTNMTFNRVRFGGAEFVPTEATNKQVTLSAAQCVSFMSVPAQHYPELTRLQADLRHAQKLLRDLPIALEYSKTAQLKAVESDDRDLLELGAMTYEQHRIRAELSQQQEKAAANQQRIDAMIATPKRRLWYASEFILDWMDHHELDGALVIAFESVESYARSARPVPEHLIQRLAKGVKRKREVDEEDEA
jgi:hypothetical protein